MKDKFKNYLEIIEHLGAIIFWGILIVYVLTSHFVINIALK